MPEISYEELKEHTKNKEKECHEIEFDALLNFKRNWKKYTLIIFSILSLCLYLNLSIETKSTDLDIIRQKGNEILKLENSLIWNQIEQRTISKELKEITQKFNSLKSWENIINKNIKIKRDEIKNLINK